MKQSLSRILVPFIIGINIVFTIAVLMAFWHTGAEPSTLIVSWFGFTGGELWLMATIKKAKIKGGNNNDSGADS